MPLTEEEALDRLKRMLREPAGTPELVLATEDLEDLMSMARRADADGLAPSHDDWTPTFDLNFAAAEGWRRKAGAAAGLFNHSVDGATFQRARIYEACIQQANTYVKKAPMTITVTLPDPMPPDPPLDDEA